MAMLSPTFPIRGFGCPVGACRASQATRARTSWKAVAAGFAAGAIVMSAISALAGAAVAPKPAPLSAEQKAEAARWLALVREQTPHVLPREWRYEIKAVDFSGMYAKKR